MVKSFSFSILFNILGCSNFDGFNVEENIDDMDVEVFTLFQVALVAMASLEEFFIATDQNGAWCNFVSRPKCWSFGIPANYTQHLDYSEQLQTIFTMFQELMTVVVPNIINHARSTKEVGKLSGQPCNLTPKQCLLNFILCDHA
jgi:hypothetical protein